MRFILKSLFFIGLVAYFMPKGESDSFLNEAGGAVTSVISSFIKDQPHQKNSINGRNTLNQQDLNPPWQGQKRRL
jgi:hypothetical protein